MPIEVASWLSQLDPANPPGSDGQSQGDDHIRLVKQALKATFPNAGKAFYFPGVNATLASSPVLTAANDYTFFPINAADAARTVTLPATPPDGFTVWVMKTDTSVNAVTISAGVNINGATTLLLRHQYDVVQLVYGSAANLWRALGTTFRFPGVRTVTASNTTIDVRDVEGLVLVNTDGNNRTVTLPNTLPTGFRVTVQKIDAGANSVILDATSGGQINGANTLSLLTRWSIVTVMWTGTTWAVEAPIQPAANADVWAAVASKFFTTDLIETASAFVAFVETTGALTFDWDAGVNRSVVATGNVVISNPTNGQPGTTRLVRVVGSGAGPYQVTYGNQITGANGTIVDVTNVRDYIISILCITSTSFRVTGAVASDAG